MMSTVNRELYDALRLANVPEDKAAAASVVETDLPAKVAGIDVRLKMVERVCIAIAMGVIALVFKAYFLT